MIKNIYTTVYSDNEYNAFVKSISGTETMRMNS